MSEKDEHYYDDDLLNDYSLIAVVGLLKGPFFPCSGRIVLANI